MMKNRRALLIIALVLLLIGVVSIINAYYLVEEVVVYPVDAVVSGYNQAGLNLDPDKLHYGKVPINSPGAFRDMDFGNKYDYPLTFNLKMKGDMAPFMYYQHDGIKYSDLFFEVLPEEKETVRIFFYPDPSKMEVDQYITGELQVVIKRKTFFDNFLY